MRNSKKLNYAFFDGDNIGSAIEHLLNSGKESEATHLSESIKLAIFKIEKYITRFDGIELVMAGGDDVLIKYDCHKYNIDLLEAISRIFYLQTGLSMSCGVGEDVSQAIINLAKVKEQRKGMINQATEMGLGHNITFKPTKLFIFTTSGITDPYINVIAHCLAHHSPLIQVVLIGIIDDRRKMNQQKGDLESLRSKITEQIDKLCEGKYLKKVDKNFEVLEIDVQETDRQIYSKLKHIDIDIKPIVYEDLEKEVVKLLTELELNRCVFDVTTVLKSYLVDIYTILRFRNITSIYSFELFDRRTFDEKELIHNLTYKKKYTYICLSESDYTKDKMIINETSIIREVDYNNLANAFKNVEKARDLLEETVSSNFARMGTLTYCLAYGLFIYFLNRHKNIVNPDGWAWIEPRIWLSVIVFLLFQYLLQGLFAWSVPSINPTNLYTVLKTWKKKQILKCGIEEDLE